MARILHFPLLSEGTSDVMIVPLNVLAHCTLIEVVDPTVIIEPIGAVFCVRTFSTFACATIVSESVIGFVPSWNRHEMNEPAPVDSEISARTSAFTSCLPASIDTDIPVMSVHAPVEPLSVVVVPVAVAVVAVIHG